MINIFDLRIIVTIGNGEGFRNNDEIQLSFAEFFPELGYKSVEQAIDEFKHKCATNTF